MSMITSERRTGGQEKAVRRLAEDSANHGVELALEKVVADKDGWQRVLTRGGELRTAIAEVIVAKIRELSLELPEMPCFGIADWQVFHKIILTPKQIASVGKFPWSDAVLNEPCPFHSGKMIRETHFAFVGIDKISVLKLQNLFPQSGQPRFASYAPDAWYEKHPFASKEMLKLRWYLCLKDIVPNSESKLFDEQLTMLPKGYEVPLAVVEIAKDLLIFQKTGVHANPNRYARTASFASGGLRVCVGLCDAVGVNVGDWDGDRYGNVGVGASRKLPSIVHR